MFFAFLFAPANRRAETTPLTLEQELRTRGLEIYPLGKVRIYQEQMRVKGDLYSAWDRVNDVHSMNPPPGITDVVNRAQTIPDTKVYAERFRNDPFVFIERGSGHMREIYCIGYWDAPGFQP